MQNAHAVTRWLSQIASALLLLGVASHSAATNCTNVGNCTPGAANGVCIQRGCTQLPNWKLIQRTVTGGTANTAAITIPYRYVATSMVRVEARIVTKDTGIVLAGHDWGDHQVSRSPAASPTAANLALGNIPQGGNYDIDIRVVNPSTGAVLAQDTAANIGIGDVFVVGGQSNMVGCPCFFATCYPAAPGTEEQPDDRVHLFANDYNWRRGSEPMDDATSQVDGVSLDNTNYADGCSHGLMLRFAKEAVVASGVPVAIIPGPRAATCLVPGCASGFTISWERPANPENQNTLYGSLVHRAKVHGYAKPVRGFLWYQGESDSGRSTTEYLNALTSHVANLRADLNAPNLFFGNVQLATQFGLGIPNADTTVAIQEAQREFATQDAQSTVVSVIDLDTIFVHLSVASYKEAGRRLGRATAAKLYAPVVPFAQATLQSIRLEPGHLDRVLLTYDRAVQGGEPSVYKVDDAGTPIAVNAVTSTGSIVTLELASPIGIIGGCVPTTAATVSYGYGYPAPLSNWVQGTDGSGGVLAFRSVHVNP